MTFATRDIILPHGTNITMWHNIELTRGNKKILQKNLKKKKKI